MSTTDPKKKVERSRHFAAGYTMSNLLQTEDSIDSVIDQFLAWLDRSAESKKAVHLDKYLTFTAFDIAGEVLFSKRFGFLKEGRDVGNAIGNSLMLNLYASTMGFFRWIHVILIGNPFMTSLNVLPFGHLFDTTVRALDDRLNNRDRNRFDVVDHWLKAMERNPGQVSLRDVYAAATGAVGAASDTISCALQSFVYFMNRHPNAWERARGEIGEAQRTQGLCRDRVVKFADAQKLPFLQACIKEALRVFGPVSMTLPRLAPPGGLTIGSKHFPEGTILSINPWVMHHSRELWGPDAREFNPDRWLKDNAGELDRYFMPVSDLLTTNTHNKSMLSRQLTRPLSSYSGDKGTILAQASILPA
ncbi:hypothetical protein N0V85_004476 [Neurospora sp. IMI 360204]|nr:hypothetical protein N0V85_004476 [Neurospora sp. IMI 360204]